MSILRLIRCCAAAGLLAAIGAPTGPAAQPADSREHAYRANNTGAAWLERFEFAKAAGAFHDALRLQPGLAMARFNLALALFYDGQVDAAEREVRAAAGGLATPHADYVLGLIAKARGRHGDAAAAFARAVQRDPLDASAGVLLGQARLQAGDVAGAIAALHAALEIEPHNVTGTYTLSLALPRAGRADEGRRLLARFQQLRESGTGTTLGNGYLEQGQYAEAIVSTGAEPDLVSREIPQVRFSAEPLAASGYDARSRLRSPVGDRFEPSKLDAAGRRRLAAALGGGVALIDYDHDGDLDLLEASPLGDRLWRNDDGRFTSLGVRFPARSVAAVTTGFVPGDFDNDGRTDVLALRYGGSALYRNTGGGRFADVTGSAALRSRATELPLSAALADIDHDGDLDIVIAGFVDLDLQRATGAVSFPDGFPAAATRVWRNLGNGTFDDATGSSRMASARTIAVAPADFDLQRDVDLLFAGRDGLALFQNARDGSFRDVAAQAGLDRTAGVSALAAGDVNRDGRTDFLLAHGGEAAIATSHGRARFRIVPVPGAASLDAAQLLDYDNDGLLDLLAWSRGVPRLLRSDGAGWQHVPDAVVLPRGLQVELPSLAAARAIAAGDLDGDGDHDLVVQHRAGVLVLRNDGGHRRGSLTVRLAASVSNRSGAGSKVEVRAGALLQRRETSLATPAAAPYDLVFGLGGRAAADAVRILWPAGIVQAEIGAPAGRPLVVTELDRKPSSCPYLFTWNGERFEFVTDFLGGGELGYWVAPGVRNRPDSDEHVRIPPGSLRARDGRYELRITNELEEVLYLDHVRLIGVAHPDGTEVFPNEGLVSPPFPAHALHVVTNLRPPLALTDDGGRDVRGATDEIDRRAPDAFRTLNIRGYAEPHGLTVRVDQAADLLLLTGWTDYAFSSDNVAASQRGLQLSPPALQVRDAAGPWRTVVPEIGMPVGRPQTVVVDLRRPALEGRREFRIATNMRVYWDRVVVADGVARGAPAAPARTADARLLQARLAWRGFSGEVSPDGREPFGYDYARVSATSPWKTMVGGYTPEGDVEPLLHAVDDRFVIARPGDEIALAFDAASLPPAPTGWTRTFMLYADGFSKEMDLNSASPDRVEPLPFHAMTEYPPVRAESGRPPEARGSRPVIVSIPSIDTLLLPPAGSVERRHRDH